MKEQGQIPSQEYSEKTNILPLKELFISGYNSVVLSLKGKDNTGEKIDKDLRLNLFTQGVIKILDALELSIQTLVEGKNSPQNYRD